MLNAAIKSFRADLWRKCAIVNILLKWVGNIIDSVYLKHLIKCPTNTVQSTKYNRNIPYGAGAQHIPRLCNHILRAIASPRCQRLYTEY